MRRSRLFWQLFGAYGVLLLLVVGVLGIALIHRAEQQFLRQFENGLLQRALLARELARGRSGRELANLQGRLGALRAESPLRLSFLAQDGTVLADSDENPVLHPQPSHGDYPEVEGARLAPFGLSRRRDESADGDVIHLALRTDDTEGPIAFVSVSQPLDAVQLQFTRLNRIVWMAVGLAAIGGLAVAFWLARSMAWPLEEITRAAERIAAGDYGLQVFAVGHDEVGQLGRAFNDMSVRLAKQIAQIQEDRQQLRTILSGMEEGVIALDSAQGILFANGRAGELLAFQPDNVVGRRLWEIVRHRPFQELVVSALADDRPRRDEVSWNHPVTKSLTVHAARLAGTTTGGAVLVLHDTSELRRLERIRQEFVANVSHELKTPLAVIKACVETLLDGAIDDREHRGSFLEQIAQQSERLHALILDLLSLARIESGTEVYDFQQVELAPVVANCLERHRARADSKRLQLESIQLPVDPSLGPVSAWSDEDALNEILNNLVDNAVKYTPENGAIRVRSWIDANHAFLEVSDTGIGIPSQDLPRVFERFYRVDKARSRELGGTGLGLSIVKHLVQALNGSVTAQSKLGEGSTFTVRLPRSQEN